MIKRALVISWIVIAFVMQVDAKARPSLYGFAPAYPVDIPQFSRPIGRAPYFDREKIVRVNVHISNKGEVGLVVAVDTVGQKFADYASQWITALTFIPAEEKGNAVASILPIDLRFRPKVHYPEILFPVDSDLAITDRTIYYASYEVNGYALPTLRKLGKYFCASKWTDTVGVYPYVLVEVRLDSTGAVVDVQPIRDSYPALVQQVMSGALWGSYTPLSIHGEEREATCFLLVSLFPQLFYPTAVWHDAGSLTTVDMDRARVSLHPDTVGLMQYPVCKTSPADSFIISGFNQSLIDTLSAVLSVDTSGAVSLYRVSPTKSPLRGVVRSLESKLKFYPAIDYKGNPRYFSGLVEIIFNASEIVRIKYLW